MIFIDSNAFIALWNTDHSFHKTALTVSSNLSQDKQQLITTNFVVAETFTILAMRVKKSLAIKFGKEFNSQNIPIVYINEEYHQKAWKIFQKIKDKNVSFADCASFAVMEHLGITKAFSFDDDFQKYGFELV